MKDIQGEIQTNGRTYRFVFNLNVMEEIQAEYGTLDKWGELTDGSNGEVDAHALIFGFTAMMNEAIEISNDENGTDEKLLTPKQVGRIVTEYGLSKATRQMNETIIQSTESGQKN